MDESNNPILRLQNISKSYPGVQALKQVSFDLKEGEVHALVGENGAGKSTLVKIMSGIIGDYTGKYEYNGQEVHFQSIRDAQSSGISVVHQELNMVGDLSVADNIFMGRESPTFTISEKKLNRYAQKLIDDYEIGSKPTTLLKDLSVAKAQLIEIAKALSFESTKVIIFDEPTASLSDKEASDLLKRIAHLKEQGISVIYISHRMDEIMDISDRITIFRDGMFVETLKTGECTVDEVIEHMVGRNVVNAPKTRSSIPPDAQVVLSVKHLSSKLVKDVSFELKEGEILGFAGLVGAGRTEAMRLISGADKRATGEIFVKGEKVNIENSRDGVRAGIAYLSEDRKRYGLVLSLSVSENIALPSLDMLSTGTVVHDNRCRVEAEKYVEKLNIKTPSTENVTKNLSGGNQQKVVLAKWLERDVDILIFDEPTRGIDIGARSEIYDLMFDLVKHGKSIILVSSDLDEVLHLSDRIIVMSEGSKAGEIGIADANPISIMSMATTNER